MSAIYPGIINAKKEIRISRKHKAFMRNRELASNLLRTTAYLDAAFGNNAEVSSKI